MDEIITKIIIVVNIIISTFMVKEESEGLVNEPVLQKSYF